MNSSTMIDTAAILFAIAALGGVGMAIIRFGKNKNPPAALAMLHGLLAGAGLTLLLYAAIASGIPPLAQLATALLLLAAVGGVIMNLHQHWRQLLLSPMWVVGHAVLAVAGFCALVIAAIR